MLANIGNRRGLPPSTSSSSLSSYGRFAIGSVSSWFGWSTSSIVESNNHQAADDCSETASPSTDTSHVPSIDITPDMDDPCSHCSGDSPCSSSRSTHSRSPPVRQTAIHSLERSVMAVPKRAIEKSKKAGRAGREVEPKVRIPEKAFPLRTVKSGTPMSTDQQLMVGIGSDHNHSRESYHRAFNTSMDHARRYVPKGAEILSMNFVVKQQDTTTGDYRKTLVGPEMPTDKQKDFDVDHAALRRAYNSAPAAILDKPLPRLPIQVDNPSQEQNLATTGSSANDRQQRRAERRKQGRSRGRPWEDQAPAFSSSLTGRQIHRDRIDKDDSRLDELTRTAYRKIHSEQKIEISTSSPIRKELSDVVKSPMSLLADGDVLTKRRHRSTVVNGSRISSHRSNTESKSKGHILKSGKMDKALSTSKSSQASSARQVSTPVSDSSASLLGVSDRIMQQLAAASVGHRAAKRMRARKAVAQSTGSSTSSGGSDRRELIGYGSQDLDRWIPPDSVNHAGFSLSTMRGVALQRIELGLEAYLDVEEMKRRRIWR